MGPAFARDDAEDARRVRQSAFEGDAAFDFIEGHQLTLAADESVLRILGIHGVFRQVFPTEEFLLQVLDVPRLIEIMHFLTELANRIAGVAVRM